MFLEERQEITDELRLNSIIIEYQKFTELSKNLQQHNSKTVTNENNKKYFRKYLKKDIYIYIYIYIIYTYIYISGCKTKNYRHSDI